MYKGVGGARGGMGDGQKQGDTIVKFRVAMMCTCTHKRAIFHYKA